MTKIHVENEDHGRHPVAALWERAQATADRNNAIPVVAIRGEGRTHTLLVIHAEDLAALAGQGGAVEAALSAG